MTFYDSFLENLPTVEISFWKGGSLFLEFGKRIEYVSPQPIFGSLGV